MGLSLGKLLLMILIVAAVWLGYRLIRSGQQARIAGRRRAGLRGRRGEGSQARPRVVELERNPATGAYEPRRRDHGE